MWKHAEISSAERSFPRHSFAISYFLQEYDDSLEYLFSPRSTILITYDQESFIFIILYNPIETGGELSSSSNEHLSILDESYV